MKDKIHFAPNIGYLLASLELSTAHDNHGNQWRGETLKCSGGKLIEGLSQSEFEQIHKAVTAGALKQHKLGGTIEMVGHTQSPLQTICMAHHASQTNDRTR